MAKAQEREAHAQADVRAEDAKGDVSKEIRGIFMECTQKVWGKRWLLREDSTHAVSYLELDKGHRCSWHRHQQKFNLFFIISGRVGIKTEFGEAILTDGQTFTVEPGIWHEFRVYENSEMIEEMYTSYNENDIERETLGGVL